MTQLPELRQELALYKAPAASHGEPAYSLYDPARNLYFRIDWPSYELLCRWHLKDSDRILRSIAEETTLELDEDLLQELVEFLSLNELIVIEQASDLQRLHQQSQARQQSWFVWLLHHYLFFRIPLFKPDQFLAKTLKNVAWLGSRWFKWLSFAVLFFGFFQVLQQWDTFTATLVDLFSIKGFIAYALTLILEKALHELGHAYTAKYYGCKVPTMGIAFLVMFPLAYTDVNDAWKLQQKKARLWIGAAGIATELSIAAWSTFLWTILPDGALRTSVFLLATTTWISTLLINASPFMRFDGYFVLMDYLEAPNLHARAFQMGRWHLRETLFKLNQPCPEVSQPELRRFLKYFAWIVWLYRLIVFSGIAALVFYAFPKPLGPFLGAVEIYWFIAKPVVNELKTWWTMRDQIQASSRSMTTLIVCGSVILMATIPWNGRIEAPAMLKPAQQSTLALETPAQLASIQVSSGDEARPDQILARFSNPDLAYQKRILEKRQEQIEWQLQAGNSNREALNQRQILIAELKKIASEMQGVESKVAGLELRASHAGRVEWQDLDLNPGDWVPANQALGTLDEYDRQHIIAYVSQQDLARLQLDNKGTFVSDSGAFPAINVKVVGISADSSRILPDPALSSPYGGDILSRTSGQQVLPEYAVYQVRLEPSEQPGKEFMTSLTGHVTLHGEAQSLLAPFWKSFIASIRREAGF